MLFQDLAEGKKFKVIGSNTYDLNFHEAVLGTIFTKIPPTKDTPYSGEFNCVSTNEDFPDLWLSDDVVVKEVEFGTYNGIYDILVEAFPVINEKIDELNQRAEKLGLDTRIGAQVIVRHTVELKDGPTEKAYVRLVGEPPKIDGWQLIAVLEHDPVLDRPFFRPVPGHEVPLKYRQADPSNCDHCHTFRMRKDTYVIQHENGDTMQVGSSCLRDFLGHSAPTALMTWAEGWDDFNDFMDGLGEYEEHDDNAYGMRFDYLPLEKYLAHVATMIRKYGWVSKSKAGDFETPTASMALLNLNWAKRNDERAVLPDKQDWELAKNAIAWAKDIDLETANDYLWNLKNIVDSREGIFPYKMNGYAASIIIAYQKAVELAERKRVEALSRAGSEWVGEVKKRQMFTGLKLVGKHYIDSMWGCTTLHRFVDQQGNELVWFASNEDLDVGFTYAGKATVKAHDTYNDVKQTTIFRCKFEPEQEVSQ